MSSEIVLPTFTGLPATIQSILVLVGDEVRHDTDILTVETDKALVLIPSSSKGVVTEIRVSIGQLVDAGDVICGVDYDPTLPDLADHNLCPRCNGTPANRGSLHGNTPHPKRHEWVYLADCSHCNIRLRRSNSNQPWEQFDPT